MTITKIKVKDAFKDCPEKCPFCNAVLKTNTVVLLPKLGCKRMFKCLTCNNSF